MSVHIEVPQLEKATLCVPILRSLSAWFGIEEAIVQYANEIDQLPTLLAYEDEAAIGFLTIKQHSAYAAELYVMGVLPEAHRQGIGRALIDRAQGWLKTVGVEYLQVKTLGPSRIDESYAKTREFFAAMGFRPLEELKELWNEHNPCLIMIKKL